MIEPCPAMFGHPTPGIWMAVPWGRVGGLEVCDETE